MAPAIAVPPPLRGIDPHSFAERTVRERWPRIVARTIQENDFPEAINERLRTLHRELPEGPIRPIQDPGAPDLPLWNEWVAPYVGETWASAPWLFAEHYLYRRLLEATGYFQPGPTYLLDPFRKQKAEAFDPTAEIVGMLARAANERAAQPELTRTQLPLLIRTALWSNQLDLSMWSATEAPHHLGTDQETAHVLVDDTDALRAHLETVAPARVDLLADNAGFELLCDLVLIDGLLAADYARLVVLHLKAHPTFVSDALVVDVLEMLDMLAAAPDPAPRTLAERLRRYLADGRLHLSDSFIWNCPLPMRAFPKLPLADLARSDLVIAKGDANYRRLVDDAHWPFTTPFAEVVGYFPAPLLALRTLKAEVVVGLDTARIREVATQDPAWMTNGHWGVIQFYHPPSSP
ncbi:MAG: damage-control phosphatase ARMT1 family protein [Rhodothermus sp.]|nr:damage-control phosphatase ARMT1 family protein [Rhodothermus sp.]